MSILGNDLQGPIFFFPLLHLASATRLTVDMLRRPSSAEIRKEMHAAPAIEPEPEPEPVPEPETENGGDRDESTVPLAYELEHDDEDFIQPPLQSPHDEPEPEPGPEPEPDPEAPGQGRNGRRTRCPMLVTATQALGPDGSPGGGTSLLPIAVFLESQHVICVVLPTSATGGRDGSDDIFAGFGSGSWTLDGQLVALKWNDPGWSVRPLLKTFPAWLNDIITDTKGLAWRSDALYSVD